MDTGDPPTKSLELSTSDSDKHRICSGNPMKQVKQKRSARWKDTLAPYLFISPFLLAFISLFLIPALYALGVSFFRYRGYGNAAFIGLDNYRAMWNYDTFWRLLGNTIFYWLAHAMIMMPIAFLLAVLVNSPLVRYKRFFKPVLFFPQIVAVIAAALLFQNFFGGEYGVLNSILGTNIPWLQDMKIARWVVVINLVWRGMGYWFVIFLAGLSAINPEVQEAATVDGVTPWQRITRITVPLMRNSFVFAFVVDGIVTLRIYAEPNILGGRAGTLAPHGMAPVVNLVIESIRVGRFGQASAAGWMLFIIIAFFTFVQFKILNRGQEDV